MIRAILALLLLSSSAFAAPYLVGAWRIGAPPADRETMRQAVRRSCNDSRLVDVDSLPTEYWIGNTNVRYRRIVIDLAQVRNMTNDVRHLTASNINAWAALNLSSTNSFRVGDCPEGDWRAVLDSWGLRAVATTNATP